MMMGAVSLRLFLNISTRRVEWFDDLERKRYLEPGRGGSFRPCEAIGKLIREGLLEEVREVRATGVVLRRSTDRVIPL